MENEKLCKALDINEEDLKIENGCHPIKAFHLLQKRHGQPMVIDSTTTKDESPAVTNGCQDFYTNEKDNLSWVLLNCWQPEQEINRLSQDKEIELWNQWLKPVIESSYYWGYLVYKYANGYKIITSADFDAMWEQFIAPFVFSNRPPWIKYPQSFSKAEVESRILDNVWEPDLFVEEFLLPIKNDKPLAIQFVKRLAALVSAGDLPVFLAYISMAESFVFQKEKQKTQIPEENLIISEREDLSWRDIVIKVVDDHEIRFHPKGETAVIREYSDLGFKDKRSGKPVGAWHVLLEALKHKNGCIPYTFENRKKVEKISQKIREKFKKLFPNIKGDPVPIERKNNIYRISLFVAPN